MMLIVALDDDAMTMVSQLKLTLHRGHRCLSMRTLGLLTGNQHQAVRCPVRNIQFSMKLTGAMVSVMLDCKGKFENRFSRIINLN